MTVPTTADNDFFVRDGVNKDEENIHVVQSSEEDELTKPDWTPAEEAAAKRKVDTFLLPILMLAFFALQMDRGNIAQALTDTITKDLGVNTNKINVGTQLLSAGIVILEIPSNILLQKLGPQKWLSFQIICWGTVATLQCLVSNYASYLVTRLLLGLLEAGFIPGALYILSTWYKKSETSLRISIFFLGNILAAATTALIGAGILTLSGHHGLAGWRWLFLIEGIITVGIGIIFCLTIPPAVGDGRPLISFGKWSYFTERQSYILRKRVILDDPIKAHGHIKITRADIVDTMKKPRIWVHILISLITCMPGNGLTTYAPSIIKSMGFGKVRANAMYSVGLFCAAAFVIMLGFGADRTKRRGPFAFIAATWSVIAYICLMQTPVSAGRWRRYGAITASLVTNPVVHIINVGWLSVNCTNPQQRSVSMAMIIMAANAAGIAGSQIFRTEDKPLYHTAFAVIVSLAILGWVVVLIQMAWYYFSNRALSKKTGEEAPKVAAEDDDGTGIAKRWWWTW